MTAEVPAGSGPALDGIRALTFFYAEDFVALRALGAWSKRA
jgi:hypothetical protein